MRIQGKPKSPVKRGSWGGDMLGYRDFLSVRLWVIEIRNSVKKYSAKKTAPTRNMKFILLSFLLVSELG